MVAFRLKDARANEQVKERLTRRRHPSQQSSQYIGAAKAATRLRGNEATRRRRFRAAQQTKPLEERTAYSKTTEGVYGGAASGHGLRAAKACEESAESLDGRYFSK